METRQETRPPRSLAHTAMTRLHHQRPNCVRNPRSADTRTMVSWQLCMAEAATPTRVIEHKTMTHASARRLSRDLTRRGDEHRCLVTLLLLGLRRCHADRLLVASCCGGGVRSVIARARRRLIGSRARCSRNVPARIGWGARVGIGQWGDDLLRRIGLIGLARQLLQDDAVHDTLQRLRSEDLTEEGTQFVAECAAVLNQNRVPSPSNSIEPPTAPSGRS